MDSLAPSTPNRKQELQTLARYCVTKSPGFAAIALWVPYKVLEGQDFVARTDGRTIQVGDAFWNYPNLERAYILVHEILHVALRHIQRGKSLFGNSGTHGHIWNLACDAVINHALDQMGWLQKPKDGIRMANLLPPEVLSQKPPASWSAEAIYRALLKELGANEDGSDLQEKFDEWAAEHDITDFDMVPGGEMDGAPELSEDIASRIWSSRLTRAQASDRPGGLLRQLMGDFPHPKTPWPQLLRAYLQDAVMPRGADNWSRPSRRVLALSGQMGDIFEPATMPEKGVRRAGIVVDTSGSIDSDTLCRFAVEIQNVQERTGCEVVLIFADAEVQSVVTVANDGKPFVEKLRSGQIVVQGGGGTSFGPAIHELNRSKVSIALYLTDMEGDFGTEKPRMPFLWCSTTPNATAPFGRVIYLDPVES